MFNVGFYEYQKEKYMNCPHCNKSIEDGSTKCLYCQGNIRYTTVARESYSHGADKETIWVVQKVFAVIGAILFPIIYHWLFDGNTLEGYLWAIGIGAFMGFISPYMPVARKD
jgi:hypothetical protein